MKPAVAACPSAAATGAVGHPDEHAGEVPIAYATLTPGPTATADHLLGCAADRVPQRAAAPKAVTVLDALPVTDVGKPYKLALHADTTHRAIAEALAPFDAVTVDAVIEDGSPARRRHPSVRSGRTEGDGHPLPLHRSPLRLTFQGNS